MRREVLRTKSPIYYKQPQRDTWVFVSGPRRSIHNGRSLGSDVDWKSEVLAGWGGAENRRSVPSQTRSRGSDILEELFLWGVCLDFA